MSKSRLKQITLKSLFQFYSYKKNLPSSENTIPDPYVKQENVIDNHKYSLDYLEWKKVITDYNDCVAEVLIQSNKIQLPNMLGTLQLKKIKFKKMFDAIKSKKEGKRVYGSVGDYDNYCLKLKWERHYKDTKFNFKWHWRIDPVKALLKEAYKRCDKDYTYIYKFLDY